MRGQYLAQYSPSDAAPHQTAGATRHAHLPSCGSTCHNDPLYSQYIHASTQENVHAVHCRTSPQLRRAAPAPLRRRDTGTVLTWPDRRNGAHQSAPV